MMCELKVGQLRKSGAGVVHEVIAIGKNLCITKTVKEHDTQELSVSCARVLGWEVVSKYHDFEIDEPVLANVGFNNWRKLHFAGVTDSGVPKVWAEGRTSHTAKGTCEYWTAVDVRKLTKEEKQ